ncbi:MAG: ethanolamine ammonia-lyase reactivating factor EutA [Candidatus Thorarchaeota archaeon]|jgi:ethanolamine utilization protein EutA
MIVKTKRKELTSVGVDIGSSTSHVVFSQIVLERDDTSRTEKFEIKERKVLHSGPIHLTPFKDARNIDFEQLRDLLLHDYQTAGIEVSEIDTGAVIITGETAKKENAEWIVSALAGEAGKFVAATAGPNFESVLSAYGSGAVTKSADSGETIMNIDIGGGSSNVAVCKDGRVVATTAINVGGRLVATDDDQRIIRLEDTGKDLAIAVGLSLEIGHILTETERETLADALADSLLECVQQKPMSDITSMLMMAPPLQYEGEIDCMTFSGGVAEYIYESEKKEFNDLGVSLAGSMKEKIEKLNLPVGRPEHRIRATVIGAGNFSLQVSGSTTFLSSGLNYPLRNLPVIEPYIKTRKPSSSDVTKAIQRALSRFDLTEGIDPLILAFNSSVRPSYENLKEFAVGVVNALPNTIKNQTPIFMCFDADIGNSVGNVMKRETGITNELLSIDEIKLREGDFIDIGEPIIEDVVVPVVIKTLVFDSD